MALGCFTLKANQSHSHLKRIQCLDVSDISDDVKDVLETTDDVSYVLNITGDVMDALDTTDDISYILDITSPSSECQK